ncbi:MAG: SpoIIE family protein phosphatase [bacterium]|nr:MAG: SpoIIE family protein phosphatase [bacterium]
MKAISLKIQITFLVILLVAGLVSVFSWTIASSEKRMIMSEVLHRVTLQARNLALSSSKPLLHTDPEFELHPLIKRVLQTEQDIISIVIVDSDGVIRGHRNVMEIEKRYNPPPGLRPTKSSEFISRGERLRENDEVLEVSVPVTDQNEVIGFVHLQYSKAKIHEVVGWINRRILKAGIIALVGGALISLMLAFHITRPVNVLTKGVEAIGRGELGTRISVRSVREFQILASTFNRMSQSLAENRIAIVEKERIEKELEIAHDIQATLLPSGLPHLKDFEIDAYYHPASQVGGDYFDLIVIDDNHLMVVVGDVAGKGVPGLVVMAMVRILVRDLALRGERPAKLLRHMNMLLRKDMKKNLFVTLFCGLLDSRQGVLDFASAAHMPLLLFHSKEHVVRMISTQAKPLGLFPDKIFTKGLTEQRIRLMPGDLFMQFTDGLNEMRNTKDEEFGLERVMQVAVDEAAGGARHFLQTVLRKLNAFRNGAAQSDDLTLLAISALPAGMRRAPEDRMEKLDGVVFD